MYRNIINRLIDWKNSSSRKPLILFGARQVGKTYILKEFGNTHYDKCAYVNFDDNPLAQSIFSMDYDIPRIIRSLSALTEVHIGEGDTLIVLDEVQECPRGLGVLKYFCENAPGYHVAVAGSFLGISMHQGQSFPVGKVDMMRLFPLTFDEFLLAVGKENLLGILKNCDYKAETALAPIFTDLLRQYFYVGGMPEAVAEYIATGNLQSVRKIQKEILQSYRNDFSKHAPAPEVPRLTMVWDSIPSQLAKENKKFIYNVLKKGARAREFELAIQWLEDAGVVYRVYRAAKPSLPLKFYEDVSAFKLFTTDVGLMGAMTDAPAAGILLSDDIFKEYKGAFTELFVLSQLKALDIPIYYHSSNESSIEIDFLIQHDTAVIPVEVKAAENVRSKSLRTFIASHPGLKGLRFSLKSHDDQGWMVNLPLWSVNFCLLS